MIVALSRRVRALVRRSTPAIAASLLLASAGSASAQQQGPSISVQLPTFAFVSVGTTVSVPDRGGMYLGGIGRRSAGTNEFGPGFLPGNRSSGATTSAFSQSVHVQIHNMDEMDAEILAEARRKFGPPSPANVEVGPVLAGSTADRGAVAINDLDAVKAAADGEARAAIEDLLAKGRAAESAGKLGAAKAYYRMAARKAPADLAALASAALRRIDSPRMASSENE